MASSAKVKERVELLPLWNDLACRRFNFTLTKSFAGLQKIGEDWNYCFLDAKCDRR
jgi:hypothetical protein